MHLVMSSNFDHQNYQLPDDSLRDFEMSLGPASLTFNGF